MTRRPLIAAILSLAAVLALAAPALAGGWAEVRADAAASTEPPREGRPLVLGFTILQHGETPAGWVTPTVHITSLTAGTDLDVRATPSGADGHFTATFTPDASGWWAYTVTFPELMSDELAVTFAVADAAGVVPAFDPTMAMTAIQRARTDVRNEIFDAVDPRIAALERRLEDQGLANDRLEARIDELQAAGTPAAAPADALATTPGLLALVVILAVLAGAIAGFGMAWLSGRGTPRQVEVEPGLSAAPRGSTPT